MRELTETLEKAQQAGALNPLYKIVLTKGESSYTYEENRILPSKHDEEMYSHLAEIVLNNAAGELDDIDLKGYDAVISYGFTGEYSATASLSVIDQQFNSDPNKNYPLTCTLFLQGIPNLMAEDEASESYLPDADNNDTVKTLIDAIAGASLTPFTHCHAYDVVWDTGYDDLADSYKPKDNLRIYKGNSRLAIFRRVLDYTGNVPRFEDDGKIHILKPVTSGETFDSEYSLERGDHHFFSKAYRNTLVRPNRFVVESQPDDDPQYSGEAQIDGYDSLPAKVKKTKFFQTRLESDNQATSIAEALKAKAEMGSARGQAVIRINVGAEIFDYVQVIDSRQGDTRTGNLGYIHRRFGKDTWEMTFGFGNWLSALRYQKILKELETYTDAGSYFSRLQVGDLYVENILADNVDFVWIDPEGNIDLDKIGDNIDNLADGEYFARERRLHLDATGVYVHEETRYTLRMPDEGDNNLWKSTTPPTAELVGDIWLDLNYTPNKVKRWTGSAWEEVSEEDLAILEKSVIVRRLKGAALTADGLIVLDETQVGTYGLIKAASLTAEGLALLDEVVDGTYKRTLAADFSANHIKMSALIEDSSHQSVTNSEKSSWDSKPEDMDEIDMGVTWGKPKKDQITASGYLKLNANTYKDGEWYNESGVEIDANNGINIYGQNNALTTRATKTGTIQCYVGSDGKLYAGAGAVKLSSTGIDLIGEIMRFLYGGSIKGKIGATSYGVALMANTGKNMTIGIGSAESIPGVNIVAGSSLPITLQAENLDMLNVDYMTLPRKTSAPSSPDNGTLVFNSSTGYTNVYFGGAWHHFNRDSGWA